MTIKIKVRKKVQSFEIKSKNISLQSKLNFLINAFFIVSMKIYIFNKKYYLKKNLSWYQKKVLKNIKIISQYYTCNWKQRKLINVIKPCQNISKMKET
jgi:ADP-glucose pyrophosphorylase